MPLATKPVYLEVRPFQVAHLCFEVGGILGESFTELGDTVSAFDFDGLYKAFRAAKLANPVDPARLELDSNAIDGKTKIPRLQNVPPSERHLIALASLRAEPLRAALDKAINMRANAAMTKYANPVGTDPVGTVTNMIKFANIKSNALNLLFDNAERQGKLLIEAYQSDKRTGVEKFTQCSTVSSLETTGTSTTLGPEPNAIQTSNSHTKDSGGITRTSTEFDLYRIPFLETDARHLRAQISLGDEVLSHFLQRQGLERFEQVFRNELASIDTDINQLQNAYLNTILMSPIQGTVTGVYKNPGDSVRPGEPVFRVENNAVVLIVAKLLSRGPVQDGFFLSVQTTLFDLTVRISATIVAARSQGADDGWEVIAKFSNLDDAGNIIFPLGYHFDYDNTTVEILTGSDFPNGHPVEI